MNFAVVDPQFDERGAKHREPHYHFSFDRRPISAETQRHLAQVAGNDFQPPPTLKYVPTRLEIIEDGSREDGPVALVRKDRVEAWWMGMGDVKLPKAIVTMKLGFPEGVVESVEERVLLSVHARLVRQTLEAPSDALQEC